MSSASQGSLSPKNKYEKPNLKIYGDIGALTAATGNVSFTGDGGGGTMIKTH